MNKTNYPMNQNCLTTNVIYEAIINANLQNYQEKKYIKEAFYQENGTSTIT